MDANIEKLQEAGLIKSDADLSTEQCEAVKSLSQAEIESLISIKEKYKKLTPSDKEHLGIIFQ